MSISCTFVKCLYNEGGKKGICAKDSIQIGGYENPRDKTQTETLPMCANYVPFIKTNHLQRKED